MSHPKGVHREATIIWRTTSLRSGTSTQATGLIHRDNATRVTGHGAGSRPKYNGDLPADTCPKLLMHVDSTGGQADQASDHAKHGKITCTKATCLSITCVCHARNG